MTFDDDVADHGDRVRAPLRDDAGRATPCEAAVGPVAGARPRRRGLGAPGCRRVFLVAATASSAISSSISPTPRRRPPTLADLRPWSSTATDCCSAPFTTADGRWRLPVTRAEVDPRFIDMLIAYEDRRFAEHDGIDWRAMLRAAGQFVLAGGHIVSGGSTLTMQVARLIERRADAQRRRASSARWSMPQALERALTKDEILDLYLTLAPYGGNIEGIRAASLAYFGKEPTRLTTAEAALLVALPQSPEARRPDRDPGAAARRPRPRARPPGRRRRDRRRGSRGAPSASRSRRRAATSRCSPPHLAEQAVAAAAQRSASIDLTIDRDLQAALETLARDARAASSGPKLSVAIVVADHETGDILASVGSAGLFDDERDGYVDMTRARPLARLDAEAADLRPRLRARPRPSREPDRGPADRLRRLRAGRISTASTAAR